ncbi:putative transmembrane protein (plasmid) [Ketogulonicigenium robustum]|uniref:Putative transmembrane protein n=1 Tax=Ketogulonicigenium robustum TaxID=92947 RepID=A0A1W6P3G4_9RHOB|nr:hypothetical protein [Ketogulonicigenium robustum]ARO15931.1 putative transmembrane protein [Ketogulonicigenium robustum]
MAFAPFKLPSRDLSIREGTIIPPRGFAFALIVFTALFGFLAYIQGPGLVRDWIISLDPVVINDAQVNNGQCRVRQAVFVDCSADVRYGAKGNPYAQHIELAFVDLHRGDYQVDVVVNRTNPALATLTLGLEKLWNRTLFLGGFLTILLLGVVVGLRNALRSRRAGRLSVTPARLTLVPLKLGVVQNRGGRTVMSYNEVLPNGKTGPLGTTVFAAGEEPFVISDAKNNDVGVGVRHPASPLPGFMDVGLRRISLTDAERADILQALPKPDPAVAPTAAAPRKLHWRRGIVGFFIMLLVILIAAGGYWLYYVTQSANRYDPIGMEINAILPDSLNSWGCAQMEQRFGKLPAPHGCTAADFRSWK